MYHSRSDDNMKMNSGKQDVNIGMHLPTSKQASRKCFYVDDNELSAFLNAGNFLADGLIIAIYLDGHH
jgi:hypothetical protein